MRRAISLLIVAGALLVRPVHAGAPAGAMRHVAGVSREVRITPTVLAEGETAIDVGDKQWRFQGFDLRGLLAQIYNLDPARIQIETQDFVNAAQTGAGAGKARYDVSVALSGEESDEAIQQKLGGALQEYFHIAMATETRNMDVYVLTADGGAGPQMRSVAGVKVSAMRAAADGFEPGSVITVEGRVCPGISSAGITARSATVERLAAALEENLDRLVVDESHLGGRYDFQLPQYQSREELFSLLHDRLGLSVRPERRELKVLAVRSTGLDSTERAGGI